VSISPNSRRLFMEMLAFIRLTMIDRLFQAEGFAPDTSYGSPESSRRKRRVDHYHANVDWDDPDQEQRILRIYQAGIDRYGRLGRRILPAANNLLASLERDGHYAVDGTLLLLPDFDPHGPLSGKTGWKALDLEISKLRWEYRNASTAHDFNSVGLHCLRVIDLLASLVFDPGRDLKPGAEAPGPADSKGRIDAFLAAQADGSRFEHLRRIAKAAYGQGNTAKHRSGANGVDAGVAVATVVLLAESLRLVWDQSHRRS
jgi:hypothetical protein